MTGILLLFTIPLLSQTYSISGSVQDMETGQPLMGAHVYLLKGEDEMVRATISDGTGRFSLDRVSPGTYTLNLSHLGYKRFSGKVQVEDSGVEMGTVRLISASADIEEVRVKGNIPMAEQKKDTTQFNAEAFTTTPDATAEDLVGKLPGVVVEDGRVQAMGEDVQQVLVDGRPFFRNDPTAALRTLPAEVIDKIQIFDKESEQAEFTGFSDGVTQKAMNIITRASMSNGVFGKFSAGAGYEDDIVTGENGGTEDRIKYLGGGNINFFKGTRRITLVAQSNNINQQNFSTEDLLGVIASGSGTGSRGRGMTGGPGGRPGGGSGRPGGGMMGGGPMAGGRMEGGVFAGGMRGGRAGDVSEFMVGTQPGISTTHSVGLNYSDLWGEKMDVTGSYFFNFSDNHALEEINRLYTVGSDSGQVYREASDSESRNLNHRFNLRMEYNIDPSNAVLFQPRLTLQQNDGTSSFYGETADGRQLLNRIDNVSSSDLQATNFSNLLIYRHRFNKERRTLATGFITGYNRQSGERLLNSMTEYLTEPLYTDELDQNAVLLTEGWSLAGNLMYTEPAGQNGMLQLNYMVSWQQDDSEKETYDYYLPEQDYTRLDTLLSNNFSNYYITHRAGTGYMFRKNDFFFVGRVHLQSAHLRNNQVFPSEYEMDKTYRNILVSSIFRYGPSREKNIKVIYRTLTNPPSVSQLQEVVDNSNPVQLQTGNADLEQTYTHSAFIRLSSVNPGTSRVFFAMLNGNITSRYIGNSTFMAARDTVLENGYTVQKGTQVTRPVNLDGYRNIRSFVTCGVPVNALRSNLNFNLGYNYSRRPGLYNGILNYSLNNSFTAGLVISSNVSEFVDFTLSSRSGYNIITNTFNTGQDNNYFSQHTRLRFKGVTPNRGYLLESELTNRYTEGLSENYDQNNWIWSAAIGKKIFRNQLGEIKLGLFDILNQGQSIDRQVADIYVEDVENNVMQRYFMLSFVYNLRQFNGIEEDPGRDIRHRMMQMREEMKP